MNAALGIGTSATHMEWFFGPKGLKFSEIGCRPPGVGAWDLYSAGNEIDLYREWAMAIVHGGTGAKPSRRYASGMVALRPDQDGHITGYTGVDELQRQFGEWVIDAHLPPRARPPRVWRPDTWPTRMSGCVIRTTTRCAACSTRWAESSRPRRVRSDVAGTPAQTDARQGVVRSLHIEGPIARSPPVGRNASRTTTS